MLSYQDVITINLGVLTTAATSWAETADGFEELETFYRGKVEPVANDGVWVGVSAHAASGQFAATRQQFADAQTEARAIASILRDAHQQFAELVGRVKDLVEQAKAAGLAVTGQGQAVYDDSTLNAMRHDPDYGVQRARADEAAWTKAIKDAVQAVDDADHGVKLALREAAGVKSWIERAFDQARGQGHSFNGDAMGDIEAYEAIEARKYADQVLNGEQLASEDLQEWQRLMRDNSDNKVFTQTLFDSLGADQTLKLTTTMNDLAHAGDSPNKNAYVQINGGLSDSLATATRVPDFKDTNGKPLPFGTPAYNEAFNAWKKTDDAQFYNKWRDALREHGDDKYPTEASVGRTDRVDTGSPEIRGYHSLVTLMQQGSGYSPQFVADVTDDMIAMEKKDPDIWHLYRSSDKDSSGSWFANDPIDGALQVMSRNPEGSTGYFDPATSTGKDRMHYLLGDGDGSRDWEVVEVTEWRGNTEVVKSTEDSDNRKGLGDALTAAATGIDPNSSHPPGPTSHTDANNRVFVHTLEVLAGQGDDMPASLRDDMAKIMTNHGDEVYVAMSDPSGTRQPSDGVKLEMEQVMEVTKQISRSEHSYGLLHEGMNYAIMNDVYDRTREPGDTLKSAGYAVGFMEEARYLALKTDQHDYTWDKAWSYHSSGAILNFVPGYGDILQRGADMVTSAWIMDEQQQQAAKLTSDSQLTYELRRNQLNAIAQQWYAANSDWAHGRDGYSYEDGMYKTIAGAANHGNALAEGISGVQ
ncbi:hypothetical protein [Streptomyces sp. NPDC018693]|uniref:hypothetical protein n=1 Tax=unclassified Streptomyces TaxID=2593676 RepID=UPI003796B712